MKTRREKWIHQLNAGQKIDTEFYREREKLYKGYVENLNIKESVTDLISKDINRTKITPITGLATNYLETIRHGEKTKEIVCRILKVFAYTNKSIGYVQGMNIICAVLYYALSYDDLPYSESLTYFCFFNLMVDIGDYFTEKMDDSETGLRGQQNIVMKILKKKDYKLYKAVQKKNLFGKSLFHIRWMVLLFSAEFVLKDTLMIWDRFFEETPKQKMIPYFCAAALVVLRECIIREEETKILTTLEIVRINPQEALYLAEKFLKEVPYNKVCSTRRTCN